MQHPHPSSKFKILTLALLSIPALAVKADETDTSQQLKKLQQMVEQLQQQRIEQDKQIELLTRELAVIENQVSQVKIVKSEESSKGTPIYGGYKDGLAYIHTEFDNDILVNGKLDDVEQAIVMRAQYDF